MTSMSLGTDHDLGMTPREGYFHPGSLLLLPLTPKITRLLEGQSTEDCHQQHPSSPWSSLFLEVELTSPQTSSGRSSASKPLQGCVSTTQTRDF